MLPFCGLTRPTTKPAQTSLTTAAEALIEVLEQVDQYPALYLNHRVLQNAIFRYEYRWIPLLATQPAPLRTSLVPPLDVQWVWFCHMLCPLQYIRDSAAMWHAIRGEHDVIIDHKLFLGPEREDGRRRAELIWSELFPDESFDILRSLKEAPIHEGMHSYVRKNKKQHIVESNISYDIVSAAERQMTFHYQVGIMPQYKDHTFLRHSVKRYNNMFLKLQKRFPEEIWVPTYDIDIIWHAHMMHPRWYKETTEKLVGSVLPHDDTLNERTTGSQIDLRWNATFNKWNKIFREPIVRHGGMWRGSIHANEVMERPRIKKLVQVVENRTLSTLERFSSFRRNGLSQRMQFSVVYGGGVNWDETHMDWVHMTDWRTSNRNGRSQAEGMDNKIERLTFLKHDDLPRLLTCRTLHFLMYNNRNRPYGFGTVLEIFGVGTSLDIPLATAHYARPHSVCKAEITNSTQCTRRFLERVLLLRVGGEDYGLLFGKWTGFSPPKSGRAFMEESQGDPGQLELHLWLLGKHSTNQWVRMYRKGSSKEPGHYSFELPILSDGRISSQAPVQFDFENATVFIGHARLVIPAYLISMAAAALHVTLQPRFAPKGWSYLRSTSTMYPEWSVPQNPYDMLRGAGGEVKEQYGNRGLWIMLLQISQSSKDTTGGAALAFSGSIDDIRAPIGAVAPGGNWVNLGMVGLTAFAFALGGFGY